MVQISGKSQTLREIASYCNTGPINSSNVIFEKLIFAGVNRDTAQIDLDAIKTMPRPGEHVPPLHSAVNLGVERNIIHDETYIQARTQPNDHPTNHANFYTKLSTLNLDGLNRITLLNHQQRGDLKYPAWPFAKLLTDDDKRAKLRSLLYESLNLYFAIDMSNGDELHIKFGSEPPPDERSVSDATLEYMRVARGLNQISDGVKAYTGILVQLYAGNPKIIIIDEPEAFLHPSLAHKLGKQLAKGAIDEGKHIFVATHSSHFVMGAIASGAKVNIVRLTYENGVASARLLPNDDLVKLMKDPLLRSAGMLSGLFYNYVIVGEADADRAFYQEINERLIDTGDLRGTQHVLFLNADNKQTIPKILAPLRRLGIPAAAVVDIDIVKDGGDEWVRHLKACSVPPSEYQPYGTRRANVLTFLTNKTPKFKVLGGINLLSDINEYEAANNLFDELARYGLFVVQHGEVENWLANLEIPRSKHLWLSSIFDKMGNDPQAFEYVHPTTGDVWDFIGEISKWFTNSQQKRIPV